MKVFAHGQDEDFFCDLLRLTSHPKRFHMFSFFQFARLGECVVFSRAGARTLIGGMCIHILGYARLISFEINFITKETSRAEPEHMNIQPPPPN